ncbi:MAG: hypothetical protein ACYTFA_05290 [Planctomycetota bacterium]|jgi:hypothetical protein
MEKGSGRLMRLWTWHKPDFSLLDGRVDHEQSEYACSVPGLRNAYRELFSRLGTSQLIWCDTLPDQRMVRAGHTEIEWILEVPSEAIVRFVGDVVWNRILGKRCALPPEIRWARKNKALHRFPDNTRARKEFEKAEEESFWTQRPPSGSWWDDLFTQEQAKECVSALVPHPCKTEWVVSNPL